jgi:integrating conjugative element protein (TIGR03752 family)
MTSNIVLKILAIVAAVILAVVVIKNHKAEELVTTLKNTQIQAEPGMVDLVSVENSMPTVGGNLEIDPLTEKFLSDEYNVDVDTPVETMRTLTEETRAVREDSLQLQEKNRKLQQEVDRLLKMEGSINQRVASQFRVSETEVEQRQKELEHRQTLTQGLIRSLELRLEQFNTDDSITQKRGSSRTAGGYELSGSDIPTGLGYDDQGVSVDFDQVIWQKPSDVTVDARDPSKISMPNFNIDEIVKSAPGIPTKLVENKKKTKEERMVKVYTIPENATLLGSVSMTALLGRIPTNGQVIDPYPFKVMVGEKNLSSNGIKIPGVVGIKMSGVAKGDWTLGCASGQIYSMTFTFRDGTIRTIPEPGTQNPSAIAWFSDKYGIPCVTGLRITNAVSYLTGRVGLTAASAYAEAKAASEFTTTSNSDGGSSRALTGDPMVVAKNSAVSSGLGEVTDWLDERQANSFDAIYVPPGTELAIHITQELKIDYDPEGRKVNHYAAITRRSERHLD